MNYEWIICGGGIHGVHLAARLIGEVGIPAEEIRIIDPGDTLLADWNARTNATGMTHLRSPSVHHLDLNPMALQQFARCYGRRMSNLYMAPYQRPSLELFNAHSQSIIERYELPALHICDKVMRCKLKAHEVELTTQNGGVYAAKQMILAIGSGEESTWPEGLPRHNPKIQYIFDRGFIWPELDPSKPVMVFGGGISAGQVALRLLKTGFKVHLIARHQMREHQFDSDPGWLGPKNMAGFLRETCLVRRRAKIRAARHRGSVPGDVRRALLQHARLGNFYWHQEKPKQWSLGQEEITVELTDELSLSAQHVFLATGLGQARPGGNLVDEMISSMNLPVAPCGFPIVDSSLRWHSRIFVSGRLAELELGPVAGNIAGARRAGDRLVELCAKPQTTCSWISSPCLTDSAFSFHNVENTNALEWVETIT